MAAQWPPSFADNQGFPNLGFRIVYRGPETLRTQFPDGRVYLREKSPQIVRTFFETWELDRADMTLLLEFYNLVGMAEKFSRRTFDPEDFDNHNTTAVFATPPSVEQFGPDRYTVSLEHIETDL